ncbi:hypothetical protein PTT_12367 [Pyrenophora teres f. teres 0-1]|uniref:Uncharacterized protein n=1 Tax=Pyrenophora teres f. teres (strain 0-1) TaxID=861557 RepID=E3RTL7_PYRTT|nr:hypothetical protein PTT_12367 [Pyrenophora teres f. teres 0-1]
MRFTNTIISSVSTLALISSALPISESSSDGSSILDPVLGLVTDSTTTGNGLSELPGLSGQLSQQGEDTHMGETLRLRNTVHASKKRSETIFDSLGEVGIEDRDSIWSEDTLEMLSAGLVAQLLREMEQRDIDGEKDTIDTLVSIPVVVNRPDSASAQVAKSLTPPLFPRQALDVGLTEDEFDGQNEIGGDVSSIGGNLREETSDIVATRVASANPSLLGGSKRSPDGILDSILGNSGGDKAPLNPGLISNPPLLGGLRGRTIAKRREAVKAANVGRTPLELRKIMIYLPKKKVMKKLVKNLTSMQGLKERLGGRAIADTSADADAKTVKRQVRGSDLDFSDPTDTGGDLLGQSGLSKRQSGPDVVTILLSIVPSVGGNSPVSKREEGLDNIDIEGIVSTTTSAVLSILPENGELSKRESGAGLVGILVAIVFH